MMRYVLGGMRAHSRLGVGVSDRASFASSSSLSLRVTPEWDFTLVHLVAVPISSLVCSRSRSRCTISKFTAESMLVVGDDLHIVACFSTCSLSR